MYKFLCIALIACTVFACKRNDGPGPVIPDGPKGLMPLQTGNTWYYKKTFHDSATGAIKFTKNDTIVILSQVGIDGVTYYQQLQTSIKINSTSFFVNLDSNTVQKVDSATKYVFFKRVAASQTVGTWADTVSTRCKGTNELYAYTGDTTIGTYTGCLKNVVSVTDCTHQTFEKWVYYLKPNLGLVRIEHYAITKDNAGFYLDFEEDLQAYVLN